ncbi:MAG TPA: folylpolyglutamate synthase/dihydrofolate synthase family protein [Rickettsiales bacterium]|nr:folylpolyglutamate synthase/dihydrofolate synthase family protein [Rickettsiales bacterium]
MKHPDARIEKLLAVLAAPRLAEIDLSLNRIEALLAALGNPQDKLPPVVHVAGTNGKGSLLAYMKAILEAAGYKVNRLTSPYLVKFNEQITLGNEDISDEYLLSLLEELLAVTADYPVTFFEASTALAFLAFAQTPSDIVLLETGLGGRLDATNVVKKPALTAITPISIDHSEFLGNTIAEIAGEKAGIIKQSVLCVVGPQVPEALEVLEKAAEKREAALYRYGKEWRVEPREDGFRYISTRRTADFPLPNLPGKHQINNAATAIACIDCLSGFTITDAHIAQGITHALWQARLQRLTQGKLAAMLPRDAELWLDGGHNASAGEAVAHWLKQQKKPVHVIWGMLKTKDAKQFLAPCVPYIRSLSAMTIEGKPDSFTPQELAEIGRSHGIESFSVAGAKEGIEGIIARENGPFTILICGSLYLAGNILWQNGLNP